MKSWIEHYEYKGALSIANAEDLRPIVRKAAKAANQRLVRLERAGLTKGVYAMATSRLELGGKGKRFKEQTKNLNLQQLRSEYAQLRDFLTAKSSTVAGQKNINRNRYNTAKAAGLSPDISQDEFNDIVSKIFTEKTEALYSSEIIYEALMTDDQDIINEVLEAAKDGRRIEEKVQGKKLIEYLKHKKERMAENPELYETYKKKRAAQKRKRSIAEREKRIAEDSRYRAAYEKKKAAQKKRRAAKKKRSTKKSTKK